MSLTNPKTVVTEERLAEFYQQILPYLGGMPEMLANKFSKGDMYSTDEKIVGQWIDGKPLWQKTFNNLSINLPNSSEYDTGIEMGDVRPINGWATSGGNDNSLVPLRIRVLKTTNHLIISHWSAYGTIDTITVKYTKTTDDPIAIGDESDYSTTEHIVGTWIDGKPMYQKTIDCGDLGNKRDDYIAVSGSSTMTVVNIWGIAINDANGQMKPLPHNADISNDSNNVGCEFSRSSGINVYYRGRDMSGYHAYVTLQYTKTTD